MKRILLGALGVGLPLMLACGPLLADKSSDGPGASTESYQENRALLKSTLDNMLFSTGRTGAKDRAGDYFVAAMIPYYEAGIRLAQNATRFSDDADLARISKEKSLVEKQLLGRMQRWEQTGLPCVTRLNVSSARSFVNLMEEVRETTWNDSASALSQGDLERSFLTVMIAYSEGAIDMAKVVLIFEADQELRSIARDAIGLHQTGVRFMQPLLERQRAKVE
jgi:uncharacterized protein (DUF305 family)